MTKTQFMLLGIVVLVGSLVGGALVTYMLPSAGTYTIQASSNGANAWILNTATGEATYHKWRDAEN